MNSEPSLKQILLAEIFGTFCLVFAGCGAIVINDLTDGSITHLGIALTFGLIVMVMIYTIGSVSGAHMNPAVTIGFWYAGRLPASRIVPYIGAETIGALAGAGALRLLFPGHANYGATLPIADPTQAFFLEIILTFILMYVILGVTSGSKEEGAFAGVAIGATVALDACFGGPISGASMNPARSLAPALVGGNLQHLWVYLISPVIGALIAVVIFKLTHAANSESE